MKGKTINAKSKGKLVYNQILSLSGTKSNHGRPTRRWGGIIWDHIGASERSSKDPRSPQRGGGDNHLIRRDKNSPKGAVGPPEGGRIGPIKKNVMSVGWDHGPRGHELPKKNKKIVGGVPMAPWGAMVLPPISQAKLGITGGQGVPPSEAWVLPDPPPPSRGGGQVSWC